MADTGRGALDVATDLTIAYIQALASGKLTVKSPISKTVTDFFLEAYKAAFKADTNSKWKQQIREELGVK